MCSATCGPGTKVRTRECDSPAPRYGGECTGNGQETATCTIRPCPISKYKQRKRVSLGTVETTLVISRKWRL